MSEDATINRLDNQIDWYGKNSNKNQRCYKTLKIVVIVAAALIPLLSASPLPFTPGGVPNWMLGALGALIAVVEGVQQVNQYHSNWISYRSTCEALKHEKYLYLAGAGPYAAAEDARALLAQRIESVVAQEHTKWTSMQERTSNAGGKSQQSR